MITISKVGIHSVGPKRGGYGEFLQALLMAGRKPAVIKCRDDFGAALEAKQFWPDVLTIGAFTLFDGMEFDYSDFKRHASLNPWIDYWEVHNEINGLWLAQTEHYIDLMPRFASDGFGLVMYNCAEGTPQYPELGGGYAYNQIARACLFAKQNGFKVMLGLHEYGYGIDHVGRYKRLADHLDSIGALLPIVRTEYAPTESGTMSTQAFIDWIRANDPINDPRIVGDACWTIGGGWFDISPHLEALADYVISVDAPAPVPPPDSLTLRITPAPPTGFRVIYREPATDDDGAIIVSAPMDTNVSAI